MKFCCLIICFLSTSASFAQKQHIYFMTNAGQYVSKKDSADLIRIVKDPQTGSSLFDVMDFYTDGKEKMEARSTTLQPVTLSGIAHTFYTNGNRKQVITYKNNKITGEYDEYFPNAKPYFTKMYGNPDSIDKDKKPVPQLTLIKACYDSTGKVLATNGNGYFVAYNDDFKSVSEEGNIKDGLRVGAWKGYLAALKINFTEDYQDGKLTRGVSNLPGGAIAIYHSRLVEPQFKGGLEGFKQFLQQNLQYPTVDRQDHIQGSVALKFNIGLDGHVADIKIYKPLSKATDAEAIHFIKLSDGQWTPASFYGIRILYPFYQTINFVLQ